MNLHRSHSNCNCSNRISFSSFVFHSWCFFNYSLSIMHHKDQVFIAVPNTTQTQERINDFNIWSASSCCLPIILNSISIKYISSISLIEHDHCLMMTVMLSVFWTINQLFFLAFTFQSYHKSQVSQKLERT